MSWETITHYISAFMDKPVVIAVTSVLTILASVLAIFSKTSLGKRAINNLSAVCRTSDEKASAAFEKVRDIEKLAKDEIKALAAEYEQKTESLKQNYEQRTAVLISIVNYYEETVFSALEKIPNAKVQKEINILKENYASKKQEITEVIGVIYQDYDATVDSIRNEARAEYDEKISYLENQIKELSLYINEIKEVEPNGQERENTDSTKEDIQENQ